MSRSTIFLSHAVIPKDNEFVLWLGSRLQMLGYKVWCDLFSLKGGEQDFWGKVIEPEIRDRAAKFVLIVSKAGILRQGVIDEYNFARGIAQEKDLKDFVIPIRLEDIPFTSRIGLNSYNVINCHQNWQEGLKTLLSKLEEDRVEKANSNGLNSYFRQLVYDSYDNVFEKKELYYSSWLKPIEVPESFFLLKFNSASQAKAVLRFYIKDYPITRHGNYLVSFHNKINTTLKPDVNEFDFDSFQINPSEIIEVKISDIEENNNVSFPTKKDCQFLFKRIMNWAFGYHLTKRGARFFELSKMRECYYFENGYKIGNKATVKYHNRLKKKNLVGKFGEDTWHFGISFNFQVEPYPVYYLNTHILFSSDGKSIWKSANKLHAARRKKGRTWFNEQWRDQLMAFLSYIKIEGEDEYIYLSVSDSTKLKLPCLTESYVSEFGYKEPSQKDRLDIINGKDEDIELNQNIVEEYNGI